MKTSLIIIALSLLLSSCGGGAPPTETAAEKKTPACDLKFSQKAANKSSIDGQKTNAYTFFVENFDREAPCWEPVNQAAQAAAAKGEKTSVLFFDCPHHTPTELSTEAPDVVGEYKDYCIARYDLSADGKGEFKRFPYAPETKTN